MGAEGLGEGEPARKRQRAGTVKWSDSRRVVADRRGGVDNVKCITLLHRPRAYTMTVSAFSILHPPSHESAHIYICIYICTPIIVHTYLSCSLSFFLSFARFLSLFFRFYSLSFRLVYLSTDFFHFFFPPMPAGAVGRVNSPGPFTYHCPAESTELAPALLASIGCSPSAGPC